MSDLYCEYLWRYKIYLHFCLALSNGSACSRTPRWCIFTATNHQVRCKLWWNIVNKVKLSWKTWWNIHLFSCVDMWPSKKKTKRNCVHDILILVLKISYHFQLVTFCYFVFHHWWAWKRNSYPVLILIWLLKKIVFCKWKKAQTTEDSYIRSSLTKQIIEMVHVEYQLQFGIMPLKTYLNSVYIK